MPGTNCDLSDFRRACARFPTGVTVTTVLGTDGQPYGITVNSFTSVSLVPPLVLVCIDHRSPIMDHCAIGRHFGINILGDQQAHLSIQFSRTWSERFANVKWRPGYTGVPLLAEIPAALECIAMQVLPAGDHWIVIGQTIHVYVTEEPPLAYFNSSYGRVSSLQSRVSKA